MVRDNRRSRLKAATDPLHRRLDERVAGAGFFASLDGYRVYLRRTFAARQALEAVLDRSAATAIYPDWPRRRLAGLLRRDLEDLGDEAPLGVHSTEEHLGTGGVLGTLYVLEGSSVGARLLARDAAALGLAPEHGARHLHAQTADSKAFRTFLHILESTELDAEHEEACLSSAIATFACFERCYAA